MAKIGHFDATQIEPTTPIEPLPAGDYVVMITDSEMRETKKGGQMLWLEMTVIDGPMEGRKVWDRLNLVNSNPKAVEIAQRTLSAICRATGKLEIDDSEDLHNLPMVAKVKYREADGQYGPSNDIDGYKPRNAKPGNGAQQHRPAQPAAAQAPAKPVAAAAPPWAS